jgi:hypothetical protein
MREILLVLAAAKGADGQVIQRLGRAASANASRGKTPALRFDTLIVRGDQLTKPGGSRVRKHIVRRMEKLSPVVSRARDRKSMSHKMTIGIATLAALGCAAGAFYWIHSKGDQNFPEIVSAEPPGFHQPPAEKLASVPAGKSSTPTDSKRTAPPVDAGLPLKAGEILEYSASLSKVNNVANLKVQIAGRGNLAGKSAWHLQAFAHTLNPLRMVFELDDQFDSYSDAGTLVSLQYEMHLSERGQKVESVQRMTATGKEPATAGAAEARVLPGTRDPLGMMQYLRYADWAKTPEVRCPVYDGHKLYDVKAKLTGASENVMVLSGKYATSKIDIRVFDNGVEMKDAAFTLYVANQPPRTPVLLEATLPFATARVELVKAK